VDCNLEPRCREPGVSKHARGSAKWCRDASGPTIPPRHITHVCIREIPNQSLRSGRPFVDNHVSPRFQAADIGRQSR